MGKARAIVVVSSVVMLAVFLEPARAAEEHQHGPPANPAAVELSVELSALLSEEMLAIEDGIGVLMTAMAAGDWPLVADTGEKIEKSYILAQRLTAEQIEELARVLPARFKALDSAFHGSAGKLSKAARGRDVELAVFHSYKLMEACVECHGTYARERFPGFGEEETGHEHH